MLLLWFGTSLGCYSANTISILLKRYANLKLKRSNNSTTHPCNIPKTPLPHSVAWKTKPWNLEFKSSTIKMLTLPIQKFAQTTSTLKHKTNLTTQIDQLINELKEINWTQFNKDSNNNSEFGFIKKKRDKNINKLVECMEEWLISRIGSLRRQQWYIY